MTNESSAFDLKEVWKGQISSGITLSREAMEERIKMHERRLRNVRAAFWVGQICIAITGAVAGSMKSYPWSEIIRVVCLAFWVILYNTSYVRRGRNENSGTALGLYPSMSPLVDSYKDNLRRQRDFYRHASFLVVPCMVLGLFTLPALAAVIEGRVSGLLLIPYGILLTLSFSLYTLRRRIELPGLEREIRELDEFRKLNPAG